MIQTMVRKPRPLFVKKVVAAFQGMFEIPQEGNGDVAGGLQTIYPRSELVRAVHAQRLIRPKRRQNAETLFAPRDCAMRAQIVAGIVGRTDHLDSEFPQN